MNTDRLVTVCLACASANRLSFAVVSGACEAHRDTVPPTAPPVPPRDILRERLLCRHCHRQIERDDSGAWIDPDASGDDAIWREVCDSHDTMQAEHGPQVTP
jgi:hypothetical protein